MPDLLTGGLQLSLERESAELTRCQSLLSGGRLSLRRTCAAFTTPSRSTRRKLLLVGEGNVGKTSLIAALRSAPFVEGRPTTHGIEISPLTIHHPSLDMDMTVRAWDFGGQEVYRISHQFFFTRRALYLVVWNARQGQEQDEVEGWLRRIRLRVGHDARALLVATHCDERRPELDYPHLEQVFPGHAGRMPSRSTAAPDRAFAELRGSDRRGGGPAAADGPADQPPLGRRPRGHPGPRRRPSRRSGTSSSLRSASSTAFPSLKPAPSPS